MPGGSYQFWAFTCFDMTKEYEANGDTSFVIYQPEMTSEGTPHQQGYVEFRRRCGLRGALRNLGFPQCKRGEARGYSLHFEPRQGTREQNVAYCSSAWYCKEHGKHGQVVAEACCPEADKRRLGPPVVLGSEIKVGRPSAGLSRGAAARREEDAQLLQPVIDVAREQGADAAMELLLRVDPGTYFRSYTQVVAACAALARPKRKTWDLPDMSAGVCTLRPWQARLWSDLADAPVARRIYWVKGGYGCGKSWFATYLCCNYPYGVYCAGQSCSLDNVVYGYDSQGVVLWDLPLAFDWLTFGSALCAVIEKFSDFGQPLTSKKYAGRSVVVQGHVVVFSNDSCPSGLQHRDVVELNV